MTKIWVVLPTILFSLSFSTDQSLAARLKAPSPMVPSQPAESGRVPTKGVNTTSSRPVKGAASSDIRTGPRTAKLGSTAANGSQSVVAASTAQSSNFFKNWTVFFTSHYEGTHITNPTNPYKVDAYGNDKSVNTIFMTWTGAGYKFTPEISLTAVANYGIIPGDGKGLVWFDPYPKIKHSKLIHFDTDIGTFNDWGDFRVYPSIVEESRKKDLLFGLRTTHGTVFSFKNSNFLIAHDFYFRTWFFGPDAKSSSQGTSSSPVEGEKNLEVYSGPYIGYKFSDNVELDMQYEMKAGHDLGDDLDNWYSITTDLSFGLSWDITKNFNFTPHIDLSTGGRIAPETTTYGAWFNASF